ncbi:hypothetical protein [Chitinophaga solisilvae]|uniref:Uncharacterized protein n=1 Tax=Chitinophaga solisilvae TaxID=1233460 RepID=A0A9Q5D5M3_9BACT|nr:hypothetical protein [Chitinophaga solisilvae]NSL86838.1 hypothetical protein [Chitinophaga solisilvae]
MSLLNNNNKKNGKKDNKQTKNALPGANNVAKPGALPSSFNRKPVKTGGTRGS